jgi:hypothetical protein
VGKIQTADIHARVDELIDDVFVSAGRTYRGDDLRLTHV